MTAKNIHHEKVVKALRKEGWSIAHDPLWLEYGERDLFVDLVAEKSLVGPNETVRKSLSKFRVV